MRRTFFPALAAALLALFVLANPQSAHAALPTGATAPDFELDAALDGSALQFSLYEALKNGPVVLYFYPAAFTKGCTIEAHNFAEAIDDYAHYNATVLGVSADDLETLKEFSVSACQSKFAVAADPQARVIQAYSASTATRPGTARRISYVITPDHTVYYHYQSSNPDHHVQNTLAALKQWAQTQPANP